MTIRALEKEVLDLAPRLRIRFAEKIVESVDDFTSKEIEAAWAQEIETGKVKGVPAKQVIAKARQVLNEARRISSARRK